MKIRFRWHWWQFWRPLYPRPCKVCYAIACLDEGQWLQHQYMHWQQGGSIEARLTALASEVKMTHAHTRDLMARFDAMTEVPEKGKLN